MHLRSRYRRFRYLLTAFGTAASLLFGDTSRAGWKGYLSLGSEYAYRGLRLTENDAAASAMLEYQSRSGFYAGVWIGHLDLPNNDPRSEELNLLWGYTRNLGSQWALDTTVIHYRYPESNLQKDYDWDEWLLALHYQQRWTVRLGVNQNWLASDKTAGLLELTYRYNLPLDFTSDATLGYNRVDDIVGTNYRYYELGFNRSLQQLQLRLALTGADSRAADVFGRSNTESRWVASLTWLF